MVASETGYWNVTKEKIKAKYPMICDADLRFNDGKEKEMMDMLGYKLGKSREELRDIISLLV